MPGSKARKAEKRRAAILAANPAMLPLLELFSVCDDVFTTEGAFEPAHINKSLGRCYRAWKDCRGDLDPEFDPKRYPKKQRPAKDRASSTTGRRMTFVTSPKRSGKSEKGKQK